MTCLNAVAWDKKERSNPVFSVGVTLLNYTLDIKTVLWMGLMLQKTRGKGNWPLKHTYTKDTGSE